MNINKLFLLNLLVASVCYGGKNLDQDNNSQATDFIFDLIKATPANNWGKMIYGDGGWGDIDWQTKWDSSFKDCILTKNANGCSDFFSDKYIITVPNELFDNHGILHVSVSYVRLFLSPSSITMRYTFNLYGEKNIQNFIKRITGNANLKYFSEKYYNTVVAVTRDCDQENDNNQSKLYLNLDNNTRCLLTYNEIAKDAFTEDGVVVSALAWTIKCETCVPYDMFIKAFTGK